MFAGSAPTPQESGVRRSAIVMALLLAACSTDAPPADKAHTLGSVPSTALAATINNAFDPAVVQPGDVVLGLTVESRNVERVFEDSIWIGDVVFGGDLVVQGVYQPHPDWPAITAPCFHVTDPGSVARVPRFPPDDRTFENARTWFCFADPDAAFELLGAPEQPREAVIAVDRYRVRRDFADTFDTADLMEVIELGPAAGATLRER